MQDTAHSQEIANPICSSFPYIPGNMGSPFFSTPLLEFTQAPELGRRWLWARVQTPVPASPPPSPYPLSTCSLFVPVVNLEKISSLPKPDAHGVRVAPPSALLSQPGGLPKDSPGKVPTAPSPKEPPGRENIELVPGEGSSHRAEGSPPEKEASGARLPPKTHRKMARE